MKYLPFILLALIFVACDSPVDVQANRKVIDNRKSGADVFEITPNSISSAYFKINEKKDFTINIRNIGDQKISIPKYYFANKSDELIVSDFAPIILAPRSDEGSNDDIKLSINPTSFGTIIDTLFLGDYFEPYLKISIVVPQVFVDDVDFGSVVAKNKYYKTIDITNFGSEAIEILNFVANGDKVHFKIENFPASQPLTIPPNGATRQLIVSFDALEKGTFTVEFQFDLQIDDKAVTKNHSIVSAIVE